MRQIQPFGDDRQLAGCVYCGGGSPLTRDHVPSKVLLDEPFPENLPQVPACQACNASFSLDEEYLACLVDCVIVGSTDPSAVHRSNVSRILLDRPSLRFLIDEGRTTTASGMTWGIANDRVENVLLKLARGHAAYELNEPQFADPVSVNYSPLGTLSEEARAKFDELPQPSVFPEVGSRGMSRLVSGGLRTEWLNVQAGRYRYAAIATDRVIVRFVLSEYLACEVIWD